MAKDETMLGRGRIGTRGMLGGAVLACVLGAVSVGWDCGGASSAASPDVDSGPTPAGQVDSGHPSAADASLDKRSGDAGEVALGSGTGSTTSTATTGATSGTSAPQNSDDTALPDGGAAGGSSDASDAPSACIDDYQPCSDGGPSCCNLACSNQGVCGTCRAEGVKCSVGDQCCNGLSCNAVDGGVSYCGTNLCSPDTKPCCSGVICCNDDCNNGTCGG